MVISLQTHAKDVVVLVPGFFNSFAPEYFSQEIIQSFRSKGFPVYVTENLNPVGTIEDNGARLERFLGDIERAEGSRVTFHLVAHSAGGFYSLYAANSQKFEIKNILSVSTPYKGVEFVQAWLDNSILFRALTELAHLDGLKQLTPQGVKRFMASVRVAPQTRVLAFGGYQNKSFDVWNARYISTPLRITAHHITGNSDGIVGYDSAMGLGDIKTTQGTSAVQLRHPKYFLPLEHWEQVLDSRVFVILGIRNTDYIRREQVRFYNGLADYLLTLH